MSTHRFLKHADLVHPPRKSVQDDWASRRAVPERLPKKWEQELRGQELAVLDVPADGGVLLCILAERVADRNVGEVEVLGELLGQGSLACARGAWERSDHRPEVV